jgi:hypothetical protein
MTVKCSTLRLRLRFQEVVPGRCHEHRAQLPLIAVPQARPDETGTGKGAVLKATEGSVLKACEAGVLRLEAAGRNVLTRP